MLKVFAQQMTSEHGDMTATIAPFAPEWGVTAPKGPDAAHAAGGRHSSTASARSGLRPAVHGLHMVADHTAALKKFTDEARFCKDVPFRDAVNSGKDRETAHKTAAQALQKKL